MRGKLIWLLALIAVLAFALPAGAAGVQGVTDTTIKIGQWGPQTGPAAAWGSVARGTGVYFKMLNAEGGINGRKLEYYLRDDGYNPNKTKAIVKELYEKIGVFGFASGVGTSPGMAAMPYIIKNNIPWVGMATGSTHWAFPPKKTIFAVYPNYPDEAQILVRYILDTLGKKKIAFVYQNDDYGKGGLVGAQKEMKARGLKMVAEVPMEPMDSDLGSHILKVRESGAEAVILWLLPKQAIISVFTAAKMGYRPQWVACSTLSDAPFMYKLTKGLWKDVIFGNFAELPDSKNPLMLRYKNAFDKYADKKIDHWGVFFYAGFGFVEPMVEGLKLAGRDLNVDSFVKAMNSIKDFKGIFGKVSYGPDQHQGIRQVFLAKCLDKGKTERLTDWMGVK